MGKKIDSKIKILMKITILYKCCYIIILRFLNRKGLLTFCILIIFSKSAYADRPDFWMNIYYTDTNTYVDGGKESSVENLYQNYYLRYEKNVNPVLSYNIYLRSAILDSHLSNDNDLKNYQRAIEPALDINMRNPSYNFILGYRRLEQWYTARLTDDSRRTTNYYYSRLDLIPKNLPNFSFQFDSQNEYDHLSRHKVDNTATRYLGSSWYEFTKKGLKLSYNITYSIEENKTPISDLISKTKNNNLNLLYNVSYNKSFLSNHIIFTGGYQSNIVQNKTTLFSKKIGEVLIKRTPYIGTYGLGTQFDFLEDSLTPVNSLSDGIYDKPALTQQGEINIGQNGKKYHNIGIQLYTSEKPVDTISIYVKRDITTDNVLLNITSWKVFKSDLNIEGSWTEVNISSITTKVYDSLNNIYVYEINFYEQKALYLNIINMDISNLNDVIVTEVEAYGKDTIPKTGKIEDTNTFFTQSINLNTMIKPLESLSIGLNYYINRYDEHPDSILNSMGDILSDMINKTEIDKETKLVSNTIRTYGINTTWYTHKYLTTSLRFQRNESFDNKDEKDYKSDTYSIDLNSTPFPALNTRLSVIKSFSCNFGEKYSENVLYLLTINAKLYRDINTLTDIGFSNIKTFPIETKSISIKKASETETKYIRGLIDARLTPKLQASLIYGLSSTSGESSSTLNEGNLVISYRPGQFINITGNLRLTDSDGDVSSAEGIIIDWLFLPTIRFNINYEHRKLEPDSRTGDTINTFVIWYITKFIDLQISYGYTKEEYKTKNETYTLSANLNCRLW
jgi:hypothetical protein